MQRIVILGAPASGKTYWSTKLSEKLKISYFDTDDLVFIRKFDLKRPKPKRAKLFREIIKKKKWIIGGTSTYLMHEAFEKADAIYILKSSFIRQKYRMIQRSLRRRKLPNSPNESLKAFSELIWYNLTHYHIPGSKGNKYFRNILKDYSEKVIILSGHKKINHVLSALK
jgi:adenylate kinase family enzyme